MAGNNLKLSTKITLLSFSLVLVIGLLGGTVMVNRVAGIMEDEMGKRALAIARTLAQMTVIQQNIEQKDGWEIIQPIAEKTRVATGVEYIVVVDMKGIRYSHPVAERIGKPFSGEDLAPSLSDRENISLGLGVLGPSVRAFVPVKVDQGSRQVGVVVVGVLTPTFINILHHIRFEIYFILLTCCCIGLMGSVFLAGRIKNAMFRLEPEEIARLLEERTAIFQAMGEGILAIDKKGTITVANDAAKRLINIGKEQVGKPIREVIKDSALTRVVETGEPEYNQERVINETIIITSRVPVRVNGQVAGAVATFRDRTEIHRLAEELTGVKAFVEALRVQNHEHLNRLHTIAGLIQLRQYQKAMDYVFDITEEQQNITVFLNNRIKDPSVAGLLLGKYGRAKEIGAELVIHKDSGLARLPEKTDSNALVVILGNLLENSLEALQKCPQGDKNIYLHISEKNDTFKIIVQDSGPGIPENIREKIFEKGFSTKGEDGHGLGLYMVRAHVEAAGGAISVNCPPEKGTRIEITIPYSI
ncbi:two-component sensor histidine kinase [Desulfocucumis palustris]|uniref:histidine kinase n=1 Tax=Desulfocucumis palustris TaxID=1898651 RepID=A0A2L2XH68_9FIRM|nr:sensor histidine kinase [Desulfocucumis palustris]GBF35578.1 two-component sensor histidine kinase [Desulfocucumis palustris]